MTRTLTALALALAVSLPAAAQEVPCLALPDGGVGCERWVAVYDHAGGHADWGVDQAVDVAASPAGDRVFVAGHSNDGTGVRDIVTVAVSAQTGEVLWTARFAGPAGDHDFGSAVAVAPDGGTVFVGGTVDADNGRNQGRGVAIAYDAETGALRWTALSARGGPGGLDHIAALAPAPEGGAVYAVGHTGPPGEHGLGFSNYLVLALDAGSGEERWSYTYDGAGGRFDRATGIAVGTRGDTLFVTGTSDGIGDPRDYDSDLATVALDARTGDRRWVHRHDGGLLGNDGATAIDVGPGGGVFVAGFVRVAGFSAGGYSNYEAIVLRIDGDTGTTDWSDTYAGPSRGIGSATSVAVAGSHVVVGGHVTGDLSDLDWDPFALGLDAATGQRRWTDRRGAPGSTFEAAEDVAASPDGSHAYVTSFSRIGGRQEVVTAAYAPATGDRAWTARWNSSPARINYDLAAAVTATADGIFVAGSTGDEMAAQANRGRSDFNYRDIAVLAYDP
ncbi:MAG: PQQ-like beta-propeller repeat protein [Actinomycetota bacterium]|nr:PQQ-like beta-propeller repeat protein [Actinomycetota bacterium]